MTEFQSNGKHYLAVEVPEGSKNHRVESTWKIPRLYFIANMQLEFKELPDGQYSIIGLASEMSEEHIILIRSLNLNPETTLIIEKL